MPKFHPTPETVASCTLTRSGEYLIITNKGNSATADEPIPVGKRVRILAGGKARAG